jgi:hypothetical protein
MDGPEPLGTTSATTSGAQAAHTTLADTSTRSLLVVAARWVGSWALVALMCTGVLLSIVGLWAHQVMLNTDRFVATLQPILADPAVVAALSEEVSQDVVTALDVQGRAAAALPERASFLAAPLSAAAESMVRRQVERIAASGALRPVLVQAITFAHMHLVDLLRGGSGALTVSNGDVTLDLTQLVTVALRQVRSTGLVPDDVALPNADPSQTPDVTRRRLAAALGRPLPDDFGQVVLLQSEQLAQVQRAVQAFDTTVIALPIIALLLAGAALLLSPNRWLTAIGLSAGGALTLLLAILLLRWLGPTLVASLQLDPLGLALIASTVRVVLDQLTVLLGVGAAIFAGVALAISLARRPWTNRRGPATASVPGTAQGAA